MSKVELKKPVIFMGETYSTLTFTEPTGAVLADCGYPIKRDRSQFAAQGSQIIDTRAVRNLAIKCAGVELEVIDMLCVKDFTAVLVAVLGFFGDTEMEETS